MRKTSQTLTTLSTLEGNLGRYASGLIHFLELVQENLIAFSTLCTFIKLTISGYHFKKREAVS